MLAEFDDEYAHEYIENTGLDRVTEATITDSNELFQELATIKETGYALNRGGRDKSVHAVSAAIRDYPTGDIGAISISIPNDSPASTLMETTRKPFNKRRANFHSS